MTDPAGFIDSLNLYGYVVNDPVNFIDPSGLELFGLSSGFSYTFSIPFTQLPPITIGLSSTVAFDHNLDGTLILTPEIGVGTSIGPSGFVRLVWGLDGSTTVDDLKGLGTSLSANLLVISSSITIPEDPDDPNLQAPIIEFGIGRGGFGISLTQGVGFTSQDVGNILQQSFDYSKQLIDLTSSSYKSEDSPPAK